MRRMVHAMKHGICCGKASLACEPVVLRETLFFSRILAFSGEQARQIRPANNFSSPASRRYGERLTIRYQQTKADWSN